MTLATLASYGVYRTIQQLPVNVGDANYDPLFPYGFGLSYGR